MTELDPDLQAEMDDEFAGWGDGTTWPLLAGTPWPRLAGTPAAAAGATLQTLDLAALSQIQPERKAFAIERVAPVGEVTLFTGPGSGGKSLLAQQIATVAAAGTGQCLGLAVQPGPAVYATCEDDPAELHWRQAHICRALGVDMAGLAGKLHLASLRGELDNALTVETATGEPTPSGLYKRLVKTIREAGARLVFLDNAAHLYAGNENDRGEVTQFINLLNRLAGETGAAIVLIAHKNKAGDSYSGSTAWQNAVRSQVTIDYDRDADGTILDPDVRALSVGKANYARTGEAVRFRWHEWAFVLEDDLPADTRAEIDATIRANGENAAFLACLRERAAQGEGRAVGPSPGPNYAPAQFEGMAQAKGFRKAALKRAMDRLFTIGQIETHTYRNTAKARDVTVIREVPEGTPNPSPNATPNASRTLVPNTPEQSARTTPRTHPYTTYTPGAATQAAAPDRNDTAAPAESGAAAGDVDPFDPTHWPEDEPQ